MAKLHRMSTHLEQEWMRLEQEEKKKSRESAVYVIIGLVFLGFAGWQFLLFAKNIFYLLYALLLGGLETAVAEVFWPMLVILPIYGILKLNPLMNGGNVSRENRNRMGQLLAGIQGERRVSECLCRLPEGYDVFQNLYVSDGEQTSETDFVVVGPNGVFVVEAKNYSGTVWGDASQEKLHHEKQNRSESFYNPVRQVKTHVHRVGKRLRQAGFPVWVQGIVAFVGDAQISVTNGTDTPIFAGDQMDSLCTYIRTYQPKYHLSPAEQKRIVALLSRESERYSRTHPGA